MRDCGVDNLTHKTHTVSPDSSSIATDPDISSGTLGVVTGMGVMVSHAMSLPCRFVYLAYMTIARDVNPNTKTMVRPSPNTIQGDPASVSGLPGLFTGSAAIRYPGGVRIMDGFFFYCCGVLKKSLR